LPFSPSIISTKQSNSIFQPVHHIVLVVSLASNANAVLRNSGQVLVDATKHSQLLVISTALQYCQNQILLLILSTEKDASCLKSSIKRICFFTV
jgi:hypothetical protein